MRESKGQENKRLRSWLRAQGLDPDSLPVSLPGSAASLDKAVIVNQQREISEKDQRLELQAKAYRESAILFEIIAGIDRSVSVYARPEALYASIAGKDDELLLRYSRLDKLVGDHPGFDLTALSAEVHSRWQAIRQFDRDGGELLRQIVRERGNSTDRRLMIISRDEVGGNSINPARERLAGRWRRMRKDRGERSAHQEVDALHHDISRLDSHSNEDLAELSILEGLRLGKNRKHRCTEYRRKLFREFADQSPQGLR